MLQEISKLMIPQTMQNNVQCCTIMNSNGTIYMDFSRIYRNQRLLKDLLAMKLKDLRTVPTIVIAHTFCASRISYGWFLLKGLGHAIFGNFV